MVNMVNTVSSVQSTQFANHAKTGKQLGFSGEISVHQEGVNAVPIIQTSMETDNARMDLFEAALNKQKGFSLQKNQGSIELHTAKGYDSIVRVIEADLPRDSGLRFTKALCPRVITEHEITPKLGSVSVGERVKALAMKAAEWLATHK